MIGSGAAGPSQTTPECSLYRGGNNTRSAPPGYTTPLAAALAAGALVAVDDGAGRNVVDAVAGLAVADAAVAQTDMIDGTVAAYHACLSFSFSLSLSFKYAIFRTLMR